MTHTPGPWTIEDNPTQYSSLRLCGMGGTVPMGHLNKQYTTEGMKRVMADANLIAAAPDLLDACESILVFLTGDEYHEYYYQAEVRQLRAAIAKARGRPKKES